MNPVLYWDKSCWIKEKYTGHKHKNVYINVYYNILPGSHQTGYPLLK